jgi:hypothetical protein
MRRQIVGDKLIAANILPNVKGFHYIVDAVLDYNAHTPVMIIYDRAANAHKTTRANVWRSIQHAKEKSEVYKKLFEYRVYSSVAMGIRTVGEGEIILMQS